MSRKVDKKNDNLPTLFRKVLEIIDIKQGDFAIECKINPGTLSKALERFSFSDDIVDKIFDRYKVRKKYWEDGKEPIFLEKPTKEPKSEQADILNHPLVKSYVSELATLRKYVAILERENDQLRGKED